MRSYIVGLSTNYLGLAVSMAIQVFLLPFLLNHIGPQLTGLYYLFMTISNFVAVGIGWLSGAGVYLLASSEAHDKKISTQEVHWVVFLGFGVYATLMLIVISAGSTTAGNWWLRGADPSLIKEGRNACVLLGLYIWLTYIHLADISLLTAILQQGWANFYRIVSQMVFITVVILLVLAEPRLDLLMLANLIGMIVAAVAARLHLRISGRLGPLRWHLPSWELVRKMFLRKGRSYFIFSIPQFGLIYGDVFLISAILGSSMVSAYLVIWKIPEVIALLLGRISEILSPYLTRISSREGSIRTASLFLCTSRLQHCLGLVSGLAYGLFGPTLVGFWVGEAHRPEGSWFYWVAGIVLAIHVVNKHDIILHYALAKLGRLVLPQFVELFLKVLLTLALFRSLGVVAPLVAALSVQLLGLTWVYRSSALKQVNTHWVDWFYQVGIWACVVLLAVIASSFALHRLVPPGGGMNFMISISVYVCVAVVSVMLIEGHQHRNGLFNLSRMLPKV
jgi:O-antigen/teichoic acid export membrane protein